MREVSTLQEKAGGFVAWKLFTAVRIHYMSDSYDFFKYNGETKAAASWEVFKNHRDKYSFVKLGRMYVREEMIYFLGINFYHKPNLWIHDLFFDEAIQIYKSWKERQIQNNRLQELTKLVSSGFKELIAIHKEEHPKLLGRMLVNDVHHDIICLVDKSVKFTDEWLNAYPTDPIVHGTVNRLKKYSRFVQNIIHYDTTAYDKIIEEYYK